MKRNIPLLRFKDKDGKDFPAWQEKKLGEISEYQSSKIIINKLKANKEKYPLFGSDGLIKKIDHYEQEKEYIAIIKDGSVGKIFYYQGKSSVINTLGYIKSKGDNNLKYLYYIISKINIKKYITGTTIPHLYFRDYKEEFIPLPCIEEQSKIASFLSSIDKKLEIIKTRKELFIKFKNKLLSLTFPKKNSSLPLLRFKDKDGKDFPAWQEKKLGEIADNYSGLKNKEKKDFEGICNSKYIDYNNVFNNYFIDINNLKNVKVNIDEKQNLVSEGDLFFTITSEIKEESAMFSTLTKSLKNTYLNSFCRGIKIYDRSNFNNVFLVYLLRCNNYRKMLIRLSQGMTRHNLSPKYVLNISIPLPCIEEQSKIASFLSSIDKKIEILEQTYNEFSNFKKFAMQNLFPKV